jgi:hypothetical protein
MPSGYRTRSTLPGFLVKRNKMRVFLEQLGKAHVTPHIQRREGLPHTAAFAALVKVVHGANSCSCPPGSAAGAGKRRRCQFCPPKKDCKTNTMCCTCEKYICKVHAHTLAYCANYELIDFAL